MHVVHLLPLSRRAPRAPETDPIHAPDRSGFRLRQMTLGLAVLLSACTTLGSRNDPGARDRVAGKTFVVTGASSGFGRGVALRLGELGGNVVLAARRADVLGQVAAEVRCEHEAQDAGRDATRDAR